MNLNRPLLRVNPQFVPHKPPELFGVNPPPKIPLIALEEADTRRTELEGAALDR